MLQVGRWLVQEIAHHLTETRWGPSPARLPVLGFFVSQLNPLLKSHQL